MHWYAVAYTPSRVLTAAEQEAVDAALRVFSVLISSYKDRLRGEIQVIINDIFLGLLDSAHSTFEHKQLVLKLLCELLVGPPPPSPPPPPFVLLSWASPSASAPRATPPLPPYPANARSRPCAVRAAA